MSALKNIRHERFCQEYIVDYNGTCAAIRTGYSDKNAPAQATQLLKREDVLARIGELQAEQAKRLGITSDRVVLELWEVLRRCMQAEPVLEWDPDERAWVEKGQYKFDSRGAAKALELIGKHLGMFTQKLEVSGNENDMTRLSEIMRQLGMKG